MLNRNDILAVNDLATDLIEVPEWGGQVRIRVFSGVQRDRLDAFLTRNTDKDGNLKDPSGLRVLVCVLACCNDDGTPLFKPEDAKALEVKSSVALDRILKAASKLNGLGDKGIEAARESLTDAPSVVAG